MMQRSLIPDENPYNDSQLKQGTKANKAGQTVEDTIYCIFKELGYMADGGGMRPGALEWLKAQVDGTKLIGVFSFTELLQWIIDNNF
jgi:hypothetical protein